MSGFAPRTMEPSRDVGGGIHVPLRIASSTMRRWRLRNTKERATIAEETPRRRTRVARKVYRYKEAEEAMPGVVFGLLFEPVGGGGGVGTADGEG